MSNEVDVTDTIQARSDQLNSDDLISGSITVTVTGVSRAETNEQPVAIAITGGHQPFKPCKTCRRILVAGWGKNAAEWVGKSMTLYRDPDVKWAGEKVGGIRISAMSHMPNKLELSLAESRKSKKKTVVEVLKPAAKQEQPTAHPLAPSLNALKVKWSKAHNSKDQEKFAEWVHESSGRTVLESDALSPAMYTADVLDKLSNALEGASDAT